MGDITSDWYRAMIPAKRKHRNAADRTSAVPLTRREVDERRVARAARRDNVVAVEHGVYVPRHVVGVGGPDALTLVRAHAKRRPGHVATGFAAAAAYGMRYFCDDEPLEFLVPKGPAPAEPQCRLRYRRSRRLELYRGGGQRPDGRCPEVVCAAQNILWRVPDLRAVRAELSPEYIRQVQVSDAFHQAVGAGTVADPARVRGKADAAAVLAATDVGAESPPETLLRLVLADLTPDCRSQVPVWDRDGETAHDGGRAFRVTAGSLRDAAAVVELRELVGEALGVC